MDRTIYRERNRIGRFFKTAANVLAALHFARARLWLKAHESTTQAFMGA